MSYKCIVQPVNKSIEVMEDENLLSALKRSGLVIKSSCGGCASCGDCVIEVLGDESVFQEMEYDEQKLLGNVFHITKERLSCQTKLRGDAEISISEHKQPVVEVKSRSILKKKSDLSAPVEEDQATIEAKIFKDGGKKRPRKFRFSDEE